MSTSNTPIDTDQEAPPQTPGSFYREDTLLRENLPPAAKFPPPRRPSPHRRNYWFAVAAVVVVVALMFSVFALVMSLGGQRSAPQATPAPTAPHATVTTTPGKTTTPTTTPGSTTTPTPTQRVTPQPTPITSPAYWDGILGTAGTNGKVENVSLANIVGNSSLQALVTVRHSDVNSSLDVYVFDRITSTHPTQLFQLSGLIKGDAQISGYNSVLTAQVDPNSALNAGKPVAQRVPDLFREFAWNGTALTQVAFPGIFPDLTRYQAEADQAQVNKGHDSWKNDPIMVAKALEARFFDWQRTVTAKILSGGGPQDVSATVRVQEASIVGSTPTIVVTLSRLEGNTHYMWVATGVADGSTLTLKNLAPRQVISSPVTLEGTGNAFEAVIGQAVVYDHLYTDIGHAQITGSNGMGMGTYTTLVNYTTSFNRVQEGLVAVYQNNGGISAENVTAVMMKVLLNPAAQAFRVSSVDLTVTPSSITGISYGSTMTFTYTATFHVQASSRGGTIQFLYTWNNGRASPSGSITIPTNGPNTVTFTYSATGWVGGAYAFPGVAQVNVTSPNTLQSNQVIPSGTPNASPLPTADSAPSLVPFNGTAYVAWTGRNAAHNLALATYDTATKAFGPVTVLTDTTLVGSGPSLEVFNGHLYVAWLGTDGHLNVARYNPANPTQLADKVTLSEFSHNAPSLAAFNGRLYLSWRGTDGRLNLISSANARTFDTKVTYDIAVRTSPTLANAGMYLYVFWENVSTNSFIVVGRYDPSNPAQLSTVVTTTSTSQLPVGLTFAGVAGPVVRVAWRTLGDAHIHLGLFGGDTVLHNQVITAQTTLYSPALTVAGHGGPFLIWTGTDAAQSVNVSPVNI